jgi:hypothetical protein
MLVLGIIPIFSLFLQGQAITGTNPNYVMLKLFLSSLEYQKIYNFPQPGVWNIFSSKLSIVEPNLPVSKMRQQMIVKYI